MNPTGLSHFNQARIEWAIRLKYSPMPHLDMEIIARQLNAFRIGDHREIGKTWEIMMERDGELAVNSDKRKSDASSREWQIVSDGSPDGDKHAAALQYCYENVNATEALEQDVTGGVDELIYQVMSALDYRYSVHEMLLRVDNAGAKEVTFEFRHTPIWFMESRRGYLGYMEHIFDVYGKPCIQGEWLTAVNCGWMRQLAMAYAMKMFPLRDWLLYCTRYGSGFLEGTTDAQEGSVEWDNALEALKTIANDGVVLHNTGVNFKFLEQSARGNLPFHPIVEMINGLYAKCYRGVDLATGSRQSQSGGGGQSGGGSKAPVGASVQKEESGIFLLRDAKWLTGIFNERIDRPLIRYLFSQEPRAWFVLQPPLDDTSAQDLMTVQALVPMGMKIMLKEAYQRFHWSVPEQGEACLTPAAPPSGGANSPGEGELPPNDGTAPKPGVAAKNETNATNTKNANGTKSKNGQGQGNSGGSPESTGGSTVPPKQKPTDAEGRPADPVLKDQAPDVATAKSRVAENAPIAPGADPARWQVASTDLPDPQVDGAAGWSSVGLTQPKKPQIPIDAKVDSQLPKPSQGYTLPALAIGLPNHLKHLTKLGLGNSRAANAIRLQLKQEPKAIALANKVDAGWKEKINEKIAEALMKAFLDGLNGKKSEPAKTMYKTKTPGNSATPEGGVSHTSETSGAK